MKDDLPDASLCIAARQGDQSAFAAIMRRHKGWLYRFIRRYVADREEAYDLVQESFVSAWSALSLLGLGHAGAPHEDTTPAPESATAMEQALRRLEKAIAALPRQLKEPLVLTMLEGLSHKEAGEMLRINAKAVETRVYRAKRQLAGMLDPSDLKDLTGEG